MGDSFYTNDGVDRNLVTMDGLTEAAIQLYAGDYSARSGKYKKAPAEWPGPLCAVLTGFCRITRFRPNS